MMLISQVGAHLQVGLCQHCLALSKTFHRFLIAADHEVANGPSDLLSNSNSDRVILNSEPNIFGHEDCFELGTFNEIRKRSYCPFCRLVIAATSYSEGVINPNLPRDGDGQAVCFVEWQLDGRLPTSESDNFHHATRRLRLKGTPNSGPPAYIVLVGTKGYQQPFLGRRVDTPSASLHKIRQWIEICQHSHGSECSSDILPQLTEAVSPYFRLVDVKRFCLVNPHPRARFAALSYIWGGSQPFVVTSKEFADIFEKDAILRYRHALSKTVWMLSNSSGTLMNNISGWTFCA
jgi:hypothetical protein